MNEQRELVNRTKQWFRHHTEGALTQYQPKFWIIFWSTAAFSSGLYYLTYDQVALHLGQDGRLVLWLGYLSLPLLVLRNLHAQAFVLLGISILKLLL